MVSTPRASSSTRTAGGSSGSAGPRSAPATDADPALGEIFVIAVDPSGPPARGLGRRLVLAGLDHLHRAGPGVGMLYVDAPPTRRRCTSTGVLGFDVHHVRPGLHVGGPHDARARERPVRQAHPVRGDPRGDGGAAGRPAALPGRPGLGRALRAAGHRRRAHERPQGDPGPPRRRRLPLALDLSSRSQTSDRGDHREVAVVAGRRHQGRDGADALRRPGRPCACRPRPGARWRCSFLRHRPGRASTATSPPARSSSRWPGQPARRPDSGRRLSNVVYMGMGEPLANYDPTWASVERIHSNT